MEDRRQEVLNAVANVNVNLGYTSVIVIVQNICIETWMLGNSRLIGGSLTGDLIRGYVNFYDVTKEDPEQMPRHPDFSLSAPFHLSYLREAMVEKNLSYSKNRPGVVLDHAYLLSIVSRAEAGVGHLASFREFIAFCGRVNNIMNS